MKTDQNKARVIKAFKEDYNSEEAEIWFHCWRIFYMSCTELFGLENDSQWMATHFLFNNTKRS